jgi:hypothetical protein
MLRNGGRFTPEWVAGIDWNQWPEWTGKRIRDGFRDLLNIRRSISFGLRDHV